MAIRRAEITGPVPSRGEAFAILALANALWAGTYAAGKEALSCLPFVELNALRFSIATVLLIAALWSGRQIIVRELRIRRSRRTIIRLSLLGFVLNKALEYQGLALSTAVDVALLIGTETIFTTLLSWIVLGEEATASGGVALVIGIAGVYLVVARGLVPDLSGPAGASRIIGDLLVVLALLFEAGYTIGGKESVKRVPPLLLTAISVAGSLVVWIPAGAVTVARLGVPTITTAAWLSIGYMAAFATIGGYWLWFRGLSALDASAAAPFLLIQPLLGAALGVLLLGEELRRATIVGGALIIASLAIVIATAREEVPTVIAAEPMP